MQLEKVTLVRKIGTTGKGIGPAYEDKVSRKGIKFKHLFDKDLLRSRLAISLAEKETLFRDLYKVEYPTLEQEFDKLLLWVKNLNSMQQILFQ